MLNFTYESDGYYDLLSSEDGLTFSFQYQNHPNKIEIIKRCFSS